MKLVTDINDVKIGSVTMFCDLIQNTEWIDIGFVVGVDNDSSLYNEVYYHFFNYLNISANSYHDNSIMHKKDLNRGCVNQKYTNSMVLNIFNHNISINRLNNYFNIFFKG